MKDAVEIRIYDARFVDGHRIKKLIKTGISGELIESFKFIIEVNVIKK